jgi:hypothetical protein
VRPGKAPGAQQIFTLWDHVLVIPKTQIHARRPELKKNKGPSETISPGPLFFRRDILLKKKLV